jgi:pantoate--beta-alanine ligase
MEVADSIAALSEWRERAGGRLGVVPTMGALHDGHLSLVRRARAECDGVVVTIFVNPAQFGPHEDLASYPRDLPRDLELLRQEGTDLVFTPTAPMVYPPGFASWVTVERLSERWEGVSRPGHFRGVATVVLKLLNLVRAERAYFGEKDYQQLRVVERMARDLNLPTAIVPCPTVREPDGLAMSSRNAYLSPAERQAATVLWRGLSAARDAARAGERDAEALARAVRAPIDGEPRARVDYVGIADPVTLEPVSRVDKDAVCLVAAWIAKVRLIDNLVLTPSG